ncbi:tetratricopeptide repeat protein [Brevirhabdus sp.]|uniref:tetratricopeptide repeat protein n=1 Tax=Brevirhabdus sp. TaxID=2004514 RepID=UPI004059771E
MRHPVILAMGLGLIFAVSACEKSGDAQVKRALDSVNVIDETNLSEIMLTVADPNEAVDYFKRSSAAKPDRIDLRRGLAQSLIRAQRPVEAVAVFDTLTSGADAENTDRVNYADALIRTGDWTKAEAELRRVPPTYETYKRYRLEAMIADSKKQWKKSDAFYETAVGLTTKPAGVLNNWGFSKLTRGDYEGAERLFVEAITHDSTLFTAKNNLVLARGAQGRYQLPAVPMTQIEKAQLLHTLALAAIKKGDVATGRALLKEAIDTHPQYFEEAARSLRTLDQA